MHNLNSSLRHRRCGWLRRLKVKAQRRRMNHHSGHGAVLNKVSNLNTTVSLECCRASGHKLGTYQGSELTVGVLTNSDVVMTREELVKGSGALLEAERARTGSEEVVQLAKHTNELLVLWVREHQ